MVAVQMIEPCPVLDCFASNIGLIEVFDSNVRFTLYVQRGAEREVVARIVMPVENIPAAVAYTVAAMGGHWIGSPQIPRLFPRSN
jgi:hypothetical protein